MTCLLKQQDCGLKAGDTQCGKCGLRPADRFVSAEDREYAVQKATTLFNLNHAQETHQSVHTSRPESRQDGKISEVTPEVQQNSGRSPLVKIVSVLLIFGAIALGWFASPGQKNAQPTHIATPTPEVAPALPKVSAVTVSDLTADLRAAAVESDGGTIDREVVFSHGRRANIKDTIHGNQLHSWVVRFGRTQVLSVLIKAKSAEFQVWKGDPREGGKLLPNKNYSKFTTAYEETLSAGLYRIIVTPAYGAEDYELTIMHTESAAK